ncbi:hypothetical protein BGZ95_001821 [Linnemannia exigua]|uniref:Uncharacterized protein n=1 Tax=Linnemannia exigua TaxID=604196 RepID=A0AAD4H3E2_9FUNG|nr:hypothetical protein BGZ95_001821 [Linnemannia exigua]
MSVFLTRLRIGITGLVSFVFLFNIIYYAVYFSSLKAEYMAPNSVSPKEGVAIAVHIILLGHYLYITVTKIPRIPRAVPRYARACVLFLVTGYMLYFYLNVLSVVFNNAVFLCPSTSTLIPAACGIARVVQLFGTVAGFLIMYEIALTLKETDPNPKPKPVIPKTGGQGGTTAGGAPNPNAVPYHMQMSSPYPQQQQALQQGAFFPQQQQPFALAQQQPLQNTNAKLEAPGQQQPLQQQQLYQQQQQQQFYQPGQHPLQQQQFQQQPQPLAPGSLVTTTPQPGGQAIAPYTSTGGASVAVSPILPVGGYSTPSPSVGHQSPVHPQ